MRYSTSNTPSSEGSSLYQRLSAWKRSKVFFILLCLLGLWLISGIAELFSSGKVEIELVDLSPVKAVDEESFLLFLLEHQLDQILVGSRQSTEAGTVSITETKDQALAILAHLQHHSIEADRIRESFQKVVALADAYAAMLVDLDLIDKRSKGPKGKAVVEVGASSAALAYGTAQMLDTGDGAGLILGGLAGLVKSWNDGRAEEAEFKAQADRVISTFFNQVDEARAEAVVVADEVAQKHSWNRQSVGFVRDGKSFGQEQLVHQTKDLLPVLAELSRQRPLNPILQFKSIMLEDLLDGDGTSQQQHIEWSARFVELARLVPHGTMYDYYRWRYMMRAGTMALKAAEQEGQGKRLGESSKAAVTSASYWKTALSINPSDFGGELRWGYGQSLALAGELDGAREVMHGIKDQVCLNPDYHYLLARLASIGEEPDQALGHLKEAVATGLTKIAEARESQDLENLRKAHADEVNSVLSVKFGWSVKYGMFNDDITLTNQSTFPLTHLVLRPVISNSKGSFTPKQQLALEKLEPGKSHTWVNCISVSGGGENDMRKAEIYCDQSPR